MPENYSAELVGLSLLIAFLASYSALELSARVNINTGFQKRIWIFAGALAAGSGIWAMHFIGMLALSVPIKIGFEASKTFISWVAPVLFSALALTLVHSSKIKTRGLLLASCAMGGAILLMHYLGMSAMEMSPSIAYDWKLVGLSAIFAIGLSGVAIFTMRFLIDHSLDSVWIKLSAAFVLGLAISAMHYTGMWAANFVPGSICLAAGKLNSTQMPILVSIPAVIILLVSIFTAYYDRRRVEHLRIEETDTLTGLKNRLFFQRYLQKVSRLERKKPKSFFLVFIDLDGFKILNDSWGHDAGDETLKIIGKRIRRQVREHDQIVRMGGDEFVVIFEEIYLEELATILDRILESIRSPMQINASTVHLTASMGVVENDFDRDYKMLLSKADNAMYESKRLGKNRWMLFTKELEAKSAIATQIFSTLPNAVAENKLKLFFQTKHASKTHEVLGVEALLRWQGPTPGLMLPGEFLPYAEKVGLTGQIGTWVVNAALCQIKQWSEMGMNIPVSINISALQIRDPKFLESTLHLIHQYQINPSLITFEINESMIFDVSSEVEKMFRQLSNEGINISIDGFGTSCANLASLKKFPANELKIDSSFIRGFSNDEVSLNLIQALTMLGHSFGLRVVAEKIDELELISKLENIGCDVLQGFSFSEPISGEELTQTLAQHSSLIKK